RQLLIKYFKLDDDDNLIQAELPGITQKLTQTRDGLLNNDLVLRLDNFNNAKYRTMVIHIAVPQFKSPNQLIRYIIHEATHIFAGLGGTKDPSYIGNDGEFKVPTIDRPSALNNADSFAVLRFSV